jgi:hypothetical protein
MMTNIIGMNRDFLNSVFDIWFCWKQVVVEMNHVKIDLSNYMILLSFTDTCVNRNELLGFYRSKPVHYIDCFKTIRAVAVSAECKQAYQTSWFDQGSPDFQIFSLTKISLNSGLILKIYFWFLLIFSFFAASILQTFWTKQKMISKIIAILFNGRSDSRDISFYLTYETALF